MYHAFIFTCNICGDEIELCTDSDNGGKCNSCHNGDYQKTGEVYDQDFVDQEKYEEEQDREYELRHHNDRY